MDNSIPRLFLRGLLLGGLQPEDVVDWASRLRRSVPPDQSSPLVIELASSNSKTARGCSHIVELLWQLAEEWHPDFRNFGPLAEDIAKEALAEKGRDLLEGRIGTYQFCSLVNQLDAASLDRKTSEGRVIEYPKWLGNLWNACDWIDETHQPSLEERPTLADEVRKVLAYLADEGGSEPS